MPSKKVDFKHIRQNADFPTVLTHYGLKAEKDGSKESQYKALCPFHDDTKPSLKVNTTKNIYHCFVCEAGGNVLEFVRDMDGAENLRAAAIELAHICSIETAPGAGTEPRSAKKQAPKRAKSSDTGQKSLPAKEAVGSTHTAEAQPSVASDADFYGEDDEGDGVPYNKLLSFELKNLETEHPFLTERGITPEMAEEFGLGIAQKGMMKARLAIPIHNAAGELVAYCGRYPASEMPENEPKYLLPPGFRKDLEVYNIHRLKRSSHVVLVESYMSVWVLDSHDVPSASCMGRSISKQQIELLKAAGVEYISIMFDGDEPGHDGATVVAAALARAGIWVNIIDVPDGFKPHHINADEQITAFGLPQ